ncbi:MAG: tRNA pseudouridine(55) synthase TruB [Bacilli bacterium]
MNGLLFINKEPNKTSRDIVNEICKKLNTKKVGHTGTLDPMATGVLIICVGAATKLVDIITSKEKVYEAEITLGIKTNTLDTTGEILTTQATTKTKEEIEQVLNSMIGTYSQQVPSYSAVKINGKKLYEYAREKIQIELPSRQVEIKSLELISDIIYENNKTIFKIRTKVSKGTYIRSLINDIATKLNTIGVMSSLTRTKQGNISIDDCINLKDIETLHPIEELFCDKQKTMINEILEKKILNGSVLEDTINQEKVYFYNNNNKLIAIYKKEDNKIKPWKMFLENR